MTRDMIGFPNINMNNVKGILIGHKGILIGHNTTFGKITTVAFSELTCFSQKLN